MTPTIKVELVRAERNNPFPHLITDDCDETVAHYKTEREAKQHLRTHPGHYHTHTHIPNEPPHWQLNITSLEGYGCGFALKDERGEYLSDAAAQLEYERAAKEIGVISNLMLASTSYSVIVVRPTETDVTLTRNRWTVSLGIGGHMINIKGSFGTEAEALQAGEVARKARWETEMAKIESAVRAAGVTPKITANYPVVTILRLHRSGNAWDAYANKITQRA